MQTLSVLRTECCGGLYLKLFTQGSENIVHHDTVQVQMVAGGHTVLITTMLMFLWVGGLGRGKRAFISAPALKAQHLSFKTQNIKLQLTKQAIA